MYGLISYLFCLFSLGLLYDLICGGLPFVSLPPLCAPAAALAGFLVAAVWYLDIRNRERAKKKRRKALFAMICNLVVCIAALGYLLLKMFGVI
ncbi:MAG: hypothetical protein LBN26_01110 [Christensenellaceae bacterium]|jgi:hypothetical protein|nr:hypothetical protein [Christensenellaceae bacterium]